MDQLEKEVLLAKAKVLEANAALLEIICLKMTTYEQIRLAVLAAAADARTMCSDFRAQVDAEDFRRN